VRARQNSFGFGGTNSHVVLDDVDSYLRQLPQANCIDGTNGVKYINRAKSSGESPGKRDDVSLTSIKGSVQASNELACDRGNDIHENIQEKVEMAATPKILLLSAADESGCNRLARLIQADLLINESEQETRLDDLAYTMNTRRTCLIVENIRRCTVFKTGQAAC
jgi:acyl transferase domain-containing protein